MCLGDIVRLDQVCGARAVGRHRGRRVDISLVTLDTPVAAGDWVIAHCGFALERLDPADAEAALTLRAGRAGEPSPAGATIAPGPPIHSPSSTPDRREQP